MDALRQIEKVIGHVEFNRGGMFASETLLRELVPYVQELVDEFRALVAGVAQLLYRRAALLFPLAAAHAVGLGAHQLDELIDLAPLCAGLRGREQNQE